MYDVIPRFDVLTIRDDTAFYSRCDSSFNVFMIRDENAINYYVDAILGSNFNVNFDVISRLVQQTKTRSLRSNSPHLRGSTRQSGCSFV